VHPLLQRNNNYYYIFRVCVYSLRYPACNLWPVRLNHIFSPYLRNKHITTKRKQLDLQLRKHYWILGRKTQLSLENKLLVYKAILKPIWTYSVQLCGTASNWNFDILERFQSRVLRIITDALWNVSNTVIRRDLRVLPVRQEIRNYSITYLHRLDNHPNRLAKSLFPGPALNRRLKRCYLADLPTRF